MSKVDDVYKAVTDKIVTAIENGANPKDWKMPWNAFTTVPVNAITKVYYRGGNILTFWLASELAEYTSNEWATYRQWESIGAQVRKGEKGTLGVKWTPVSSKEPKAGDDEDSSSRLIPLTFTVFNAAQVDGYTPEVLPEVPDVAMIDHAEELLFTNTGVKVVRSQKAAYSPARDVVMLPARKQFHDSVGYYSTAAHEVAHWTGHSSRLGRNTKTALFGSAPYAVEELVAELSAAFTCARLGISSEPRPDHAQYVTSWMKVLKEDSRAIFKAATLAQKATDFIFDFTDPRESVEDAV